MRAAYRCLRNIHWTRRAGRRQAEACPPAAAPENLRVTDLLILAAGTFTLGVDGFVLSGLLPQVSASLHVPVSTAGQLARCSPSRTRPGHRSSPR